jgi:hypothetical protein
LTWGLPPVARATGKLRRMRALAILATAGAVAVPAAAPLTAGAATSRQVEGTVVSVDRGARTFKLRDAERGTFRIKVTSRTTFERVSGFAALKQRMTRIEATIRRSNGAWVASHVERSGGGGSHGGGSGRGGHDDGPGHT